MKRMILIILLIGICGQVFAQNVVYVSARGNDNNDGLTEATALNSLNLALIEALLSGGKIIVIGTLTAANNSYYEKGDSQIFSFIGLDDSGEVIISGKPGAIGDDRAVLSGWGADASVFALVYISKNANISFENIEISGLTREETINIVIDNGGRLTLGPGAVVRGNNYSGIFISNGTCVMDGGEVRDNGSTGIGCGGNGILTIRSGAVRNNGESGVIVGNGGRFSMSGGIITGNRHRTVGGGVIVQSGGRFDQTGGTVSGNTAPRYPDIFRQSGSLGSDLSSSGSSSSSTLTSDSPSSGSSSKSSSGFSWNIPLFMGTYLQGWHQNIFSGGILLQTGMELNFGRDISLALLGEADGGVGLPYFLEGNLGGMAELYFLEKTIGIGLGFGSSTILMPIFVSYDPYEEEPADSLESAYMRLALILRKNYNKTSFFAQLYANGDWGFGIQFSWDLF